VARPAASPPEALRHLSELSYGPRQKVGMTRTIDEVLGQSGSRVDYVYDFGSSTELVLSHSEVVEAAPEKGVRVIGRNEAPAWPCDICGEPASEVCVECAWDGRGFFCEAHAPEHPCGEDLLLPVVNSPRMGVCGYCGED